MKNGNRKKTVDLTYYHCQIHFPGEDDFLGKYIYEIYLDDLLIIEAYEASTVDNWIRIKTYTELGIQPSAKKEGIVKIIKNYQY